MLSLLEEIPRFIKDYIVNYIDIDYSLWLTWCLTPLLITFLLPVVIALFLYLSAFLLYIYKLHWRSIKITLQTGDKWDTARKSVGALWDAHGWIWHGYEVKGLEHVPDTGPALIIYYHGAIPIDIYYFLAKVIFTKNRLVHTVADHFLFKIPGFSILAECMKVIPGTVQTCSNILKDGNLLAISPGGVYESQFSYNYNLMWKRRLGFAKVAIEAKATIIPMFTENLREAFRTVSLGRRFFLKMYALFKFPFAPVYGGFPVKMITHLGKPIPYDPNLTPEELQEKVALAIENLVKSHQRFPGSIFNALLDRIPYFQKKRVKMQN
ncbi:transmembrane protein 68 [Anoplophora glabripennis]|uniref:transmembrane protein 68 n=1 Tax=Anoplophora glabripennis TaxID=217634 RepID=UPI000873AD5A|nr:transmembrane protein 68 [Anoplophora glabripennis]XP_018568303.1 transmembrane protein 68 [Anoplophora glabripennis]XP_018568304.1 transmembrane protein 68 [Anoplophora glabripennis]